MIPEPINHDLRFGLGPANHGFGAGIVLRHEIRRAGQSGRTAAEPQQQNFHLLLLVKRDIFRLQIFPSPPHRGLGMGLVDTHALAQLRQDALILDQRQQPARLNLVIVRDVERPLETAAQVEPGSLDRFFVLVQEAEHLILRKVLHIEEPGPAPPPCVSTEVFQLDAVLAIGRSELLQVLKLPEQHVVPSPVAHGPDPTVGVAVFVLPFLTIFVVFGEARRVPHELCQHPAASLLVNVDPAGEHALRVFTKPQLVERHRDRLAVGRVELVYGLKFLGLQFTPLDYLLLGLLDHLLAGQRGLLRIPLPRDRLGGGEHAFVEARHTVVHIVHVDLDAAPPALPGDPGHLALDLRPVLAPLHPQLAAKDGVVGCIGANLGVVHHPFDREPLHPVADFAALFSDIGHLEHELRDVLEGAGQLEIGRHVGRAVDFGRRELGDDPVLLQPLDDEGVKSSVVVQDDLPVQGGPVEVFRVAHPNIVVGAGHGQHVGVEARVEDVGPSRHDLQAIVIRVKRLQVKRPCVSVVGWKRSNLHRQFPFAIAWHSFFSLMDRVHLMPMKP